MTTRNSRRNAFTAALALLFVSSSLFILLSTGATALPSGAAITNYSTVTRGIGTAENRTDAGGTITTIELSGIQQDSYWKAYVGNVTGVLTLDDASGHTIYDWQLTGLTINGQVYATRNGSVTFTGMECAQPATISAEDSFNNMTASAADSIDRTFNRTVHRGFYVGPTPIANSTCPSTATYVNSTAQNASEGDSFQEILLQDAGANVVYTTLLENSTVGFDGNTYDFQMLVGESGVKPTPTTYYFYTEIGS